MFLAYDLVLGRHYELRRVKRKARSAIRSWCRSGRLVESEENRNLVSP